MNGAAPAAGGRGPRTSSRPDSAGRAELYHFCRAERSALSRCYTSEVFIRARRPKRKETRSEIESSSGANKDAKQPPGSVGAKGERWRREWKRKEECSFRQGRDKRTPNRSGAIPPHLYS
ncbi:hypothetical protein MRX96_031150 [Rhipicephalus microplus]